MQKVVAKLWANTEIINTPKQSLIKPYQTSSQYSKIISIKPGKNFSKNP